MKKQILLKDVPAGANYSPAIVANGFVFVSGQGPVDPYTGKKPESIEAQTRATLENVFRILEAAGSSKEDIVKINVYLADIGDFERMNSVYREMLPAIKPARTTVGAGLVNILVEIDAIAAL